MNGMIWHNETQSYRGELSDGKIVDVSGDEWSESLHDGIQSCIEHNEDWNGTEEEFAQTYPTRYDNYENQTLIELNSPEMWAALVGDNQNVTFVD